MVFAWLLVACIGSCGRHKGADPSELQGTVLEPVGSAVPSLNLDDAGGTATIDDGNGVQILQVAPFGPDRSPSQVLVVFDRPMVPITDLDTMNQAVPLSCSPEVGKVRWAGTSTAVLLPEGGSFPPATSFTCAVPAGTKAVDGVALEKRVQWTFETQRPHVVQTSPSRGATRVRLDEAVELVFDQPVTAAAVQSHLQVQDDSGKTYKPKLSNPDPQRPQRVRLDLKLSANTGYTLKLTPGLKGEQGALTSKEAFSYSFRTFPPFQVLRGTPLGSGSPGEGIELFFTTSVPEASVARALSITPQPTRWEPPDSTYGWTRYAYRAALRANTSYTVKVSGDLVDEYGQKLVAPYEWTFLTRDYEPWLDVPSGMAIYAANNPKGLPFKVLNAVAVDAVGAAIDPRSLKRFDQWYDLVGREVRGPKATPFPVVLEQPTNSIELDQVDMTPLVAGGKTGWVGTELSAPNILDWSGEPHRHRGLMVITDLGGTMKVSPGATELWVTSLATGAPVKDVKVELFVDEQAAGTGRTDSDGLARIEGAPKPGWEPWSTTVWARLTKGQDVSLVTDDWNDGLEPWSFGVYSGDFTSPKEVRSQGFADRGVYRLNEPVYARATFRLATAAGLQTSPGTVSWRLEDPTGTKVLEGSGALDDRGGLSVQTQLPSTGALGEWSLTFEAKGADWSGWQGVSVPVKAYRPPAFRVEVNTPQSAVMGQEVTARADARYLFGSPMNKGRVHWRSWTEDREFEPEGYEGFSFGPGFRWWEGAEDGQTQLTGDSVADLSSGSASFSQKVESGYRDRPVDLFLEAEVTDVDRQVIAKRGSVRVHPAAFYLGVRSTISLPTAGTKVPIELVAVDPSGAPRSEAAAVSVFRRDFNSVRERGMDGQWRWVNTPVDEPAFQQAAKTGKTPVRVQFKPEKPGYYVVVATSQDEAGNAVKAESGLYVLGTEYVGWGRTDDNHMELVPDKKKYAVGDVARILVKSPVANLRALVTVEREGVLHRQVVTLTSTSSTVEVPVVASYRPNVYVSVIAVQGVGPQDGPDKGAPQVLAGLLDLTVDSAEEHLAVAVTPNRKTYGPRDEVQVEVSVRRAGKPVGGAGVTLFAVDEGVLTLTDFQTPDAYEGFYAHRGLSVTSADGRTRAVDRAAYLTKGAPRGGGGGLAALGATDLRSKFVTTVTWQDLRTDGEGKATAKFTLPDNLTTFRIMAVADAGQVSFGSADAEVQVNRPLMVRPALPRLLRAGDLSFAGVVVHNNATSDRWVRVEAAVEGPVEIEGTPVDVKVPAGGSMEVPFKISALEAGTATFGFVARSGKDEDALQWPLQIERDLVMETVASSGRFASSWTEQVARPDGASASLGGLTVDLASTALVGVGSGLEYLRAYPHECLEQRTSRALAELAVLSVRERAAISLSAEVLRADVTEVLGSLARFQTPSGGMAYWEGSDWPSAYATAYAVELLGRAREAGFSVDEALLGASIKYLREVVTNTRESELSELGPQAALTVKTQIALALARAGAADAGLTNRLFEQRKSLPVFGQASLLEVLARTSKPDWRATDLAGSIAARTFVEAASASVREGDLPWYDRLWGSDDLSTAASLEALVASGLQPALLPRYALHLASTKSDSGRWANTRATAAVLLALAAYAEKYEAAAGAEVSATLALAGAQQFAGKVPMGRTQHIELAMPKVANGKLEMSSAGGPLYYEARLSYAPTTPQPRDEGFTIQRTLEPLESAAGSRVTAGATFRVTLTVVTPTLRHDVAVLDPIPAGFEPVDSSLATTSRAPGYAEDTGLGVAPWGEEWDVLERRAAVPDFGGSAAYDHHEIDDGEVRLYASVMPAGIHTYRYVVRATSPGRYVQPPARVEEMYEPENFGRTKAAVIEIAAAPPPTPPTGR